MAAWDRIEMLESPTGANLAVRTSPASAAARGVIHINHGMAEHSARYGRFARALADAGFHVIAQDHRGHGSTAGADAPLGVFSGRDGANKVLADCKAVNEHARAKWPGLPVIWFGHSMGGIIGTAYGARHAETIDGAILWNFNVDGGPLVGLLKMLLKGERMFRGSDTASSIATRLTFDDWNRKFKPNRTAFDWLSRDEAEVDKYVADPLCGFPCTVGLWLDVVELIDIGSSNREIASIPANLPVHLLGGEDDTSSMQGKSLQRLATRLRKAGLADITCRTLPGARHETLNELIRDEETANLIAWLSERWSAGKSG